MRKKSMLIFPAVLIMLIFLMSGCGGKQNRELSRSGDRGIPAVPEKLALNQEGVPMLKVYQTDEETVVETDIETYVEGVLAGEMKNDWPMEALKAQAILARTFVLKFCSEKESKYPNADISTDIEEAQAYDHTGINERIEEAVQSTRGQVLSYYGELPYAWFHAHSGGMTASAKEGLDYEKEEPDYICSVPGEESTKAPQEAKTWQASFSVDEIRKAAKKCGVSIEKLTSFSIGEKGSSGRTETFLINDSEVSAPPFRIALGSAKMRSTLLTEVSFGNGQVFMAGKGYGHGVGMSQWGAYGLAERGKTAEEIVTYYFDDVELEKLW